MSKMQEITYSLEDTSHPIVIGEFDVEAATQYLDDCLTEGAGRDYCRRLFLLPNNRWVLGTFWDRDHRTLPEDGMFKYITFEEARAWLAEQGHVSHGVDLSKRRQGAGTLQV